MCAAALTPGSAWPRAWRWALGREILRTVILRTLSEPVIVAGIIALRAVLTVLIHWEIKNEKEEAAARREAEQPAETGK